MMPGLLTGLEIAVDVTDLEALAGLVDLAGPVAAPARVSIERADGGRLNAWRWGKSGPKVVLLHGGAQSAHSWALCALLLQADHQCLAVDLRGHGDSDWASDYAISAHVGDIRRLVSQLGWRPAHLVGMSLGGVVAAHSVLASERDAFRTLTLVDVAPGVSFAGVRRVRAFVGADTVRGGVDGLVAEARRFGARQSEAALRLRYASLIRETESGSYVWKHDARAPTDYPHILDHIGQLHRRA